MARNLWPRMASKLQSIGSFHFALMLLKESKLFKTTTGVDIEHWSTKPQILCTKCIAGVRLTIGRLVLRGGQSVSVSGTAAHALFDFRVSNTTVEQDGLRFEVRIGKMEVHIVCLGFGGKQFEVRDSPDGFGEHESLSVKPFTFTRRIN